MHARDTKEKTHVASKVSREGQQAKKINVKPVLIKSYYIWQLHILRKYQD